jgi:hypothetical protein
MAVQGTISRRARPAGWRSHVDPATTPGMLGLLLTVLIVLSLAWGALAWLTADQHASAAGNVVSVSEPLSLDAEQIYQNLSDANDTAASAFLSGGLEPAAALNRYNADIAAAAVRIQASGTAQDAAVKADLMTLSADLPVYTGEVQTAQADNRLGLPLGAAYLREASTLLRGPMLTAASDIYTRENAQLTAASAQATGLPLLIVTVVAGLAGGFVLIRSWRWLARRTRRIVNYGLLVVAVVGAVSLVWLAGAYVTGRGDLLHAQQHGSAPAEALARADVVALQMHADESLTLIDNSGDDAYQSDFVAQQKLLGPGPGTLLAAVTAPAGSLSAGADAKAWYSAHTALRTLDDSGNHAAAVQSALSGAAAAQFAKLSAALTNGITADQAVFASNARSGQSAFTGLTAGMAGGALVMVAGCVWGLNRRLGEYR